MSKIYKLFGPPGTGKTTTTVKQLIIRKAIDIDPKSVLVTAYTKAAIRALRNKIQRDKVIPLNQVKTWHSFLWGRYSLGRKFMRGSDWQSFFQGYRIPYDPKLDDQEELIAQSDTEIPIGNKIKQAWSLSFMRATPDDLERTPDGRIVGLANIFEEQANLLGFTTRDFIRLFLEFLRYAETVGSKDYLHALVKFIFNPEPALCLNPDPDDPCVPIDLLIIDEAQDMSPLMGWWLREIDKRNSAEEIWLVGDDDQAILTFIGADPEELLDIRADHEETLSVSYRFGQNTVKGALKVIGQIPSGYRKDKDYRAYQDNLINKIEYKPVDDKLTLAIKEIEQGKTVMILARHHYVLDEVYQTIRTLGLRYQRIGSPKMPKFPKGADESVYEALVGLLDKYYSTKTIEGTSLGRIPPGGLKKIANEFLGNEELALSIEKKYIKEKYWPTRD